MTDHNAMPPVANKPTVLVVDDEDAVRDFVRVALEQAGYAVVPAADGDTAHRLFLAAPRSFALVLSDVVMPNRTGPELAAAIRKVEPATRILLMSGFVGSATLGPLALPPDLPIIAKPFSLDQLLRAVEKVLAHEHRG